tara:strand:- start:436 stop:669 length:234 start_codon:yes stop_codon:yes gene_type:complete
MMQPTTGEQHLIDRMKKSKIISLLLLMTLFSFIMETEKQARKKWDQVKEVVIAKIYSDSTDSTINLTSDQLISEAEY